MLKFLIWYYDNLIFAYISIAVILALWIGGSYCQYFSDTVYSPIYLLTPIIVFIIAFAIWGVARYFYLKEQRQ